MIHPAPLFGITKKTHLPVVLNTDHDEAFRVYAAADGTGYTADQVTPVTQRPDPLTEDVCLCNTGPFPEGPDETCPVHGRPYAYWVQQAGTLQVSIDNVQTLIDRWRYKGEFGWGPWQEGYGPDQEGYVLDQVSVDLRAALADEEGVMNYCRVYWGTHGCELERGHTGEHVCACCTCDDHANATDDDRDGCVGAWPYYGSETTLYGEDA